MNGDCTTVVDMSAEATGHGLPSLPAPHSGVLQEALDRVERQMILAALLASHGNKAKAARELGITERIMGLRVKKYCINPKEYRVSPLQAS